MDSVEREVAFSEIRDLSFNEIERFSDHRGQFAKVYESSHGTHDNFVIQQVNYSINPNIGTLRGLHYQKVPAQESKFVSCLSGEIYDVVLDLRVESKTFGRWASVILKSDSVGILIPPGVAHGFQTLKENTILLYLHSNSYSREYSTGVNALDKNLSISWPRQISEISTTDLNLPTLDQIFYES